MLTLPNLITAVRLLLVPAVVYALAGRAFGWAFGAFLVAGASDALDGFLARRLNQHSQVGALLDALADKLLVFSTIVMLVWLQALPVWVAGILVGRDLLMAAGTLLYRRLAGDVQIAPTLLGKTHVAVVFGLLAVVLADAAGIVPHPGFLLWAQALAGLTAVGSLLHYALVWGGRLRSVRGSL